MTSERMQSRSASRGGENADTVSILGGKFQIGVRIGGGSFGEIFHARNLRTGEDVAIKVESAPSKSSQLRREAKIYLRLQGEGENPPCSLLVLLSTGVC